MLDWNGNEKIDPVDIGISVATEKETNDEKPKTEDKKSNVGCLTVVLLAVSLFSLIIIFLL